jgi:putative flippase GtrA
MKRNDTMPEFARFIVVGLGSTMVHFVVLTTLYKGLGVSIIVSTIIGFLMSLCFSYLVNRAYTFRSSVKHHLGAPKFLLVTTLGLLWNVAIMYLCVELLEFNYYISFVGMSVVVALNNYLLGKTWVFVNTG